ncbi:SDR family oxidoreductase [Solimicrobium silvestre]|uniref:Dehydrogenases with different specificities (Related to short-chain alcohol dehydrogenases) n=1 Tax=Solimicrobium silvestre TaxID=2099400 RepID=A0A2S9H458_9BURK|nr:SDR family oxidoreductase [Solimicrobium silvestre]PRC94758.1 Dehydrogenases with different specificities (related to short-chain alcohol dehydrogenases) [Solimicrobium silvestre]
MTTQNLSPTKAPVALITGAAVRIGRSIALTLAQRGWDIAVHFNNSEQPARELVAEITALGRRAIYLQCDLTDEAGVKKLVQRVVNGLGSIQCVVNNASAFEVDTAANFSHAMLDHHMHINLAAPVLLAQALFDATPDGQQTCVVNLLDQKLFNLNPDFLSYTLSKAALQCATTTLAQALAPKVRVVGVAPGTTLASIHQDQRNFEKTHQHAALGQSSTPQDIADAVHYLASARAVTGTILAVDGGQHLIPLARDVMYVVNTN